MTDELLFVRQPEPSRRSAGSHDQRPALVPFIVDLHTKRTAGEIDLLDDSMQVLGPELFSLPLHVKDQIGTVDAFGESGKILDFRGNRKLAARFMTDDDQRLETGSGCIDRRRVAGAARPEDDHVSHASW